MAKLKTLFVCRSCGAVQNRWMGKCPDCGTWDSLDEETHDPSAARDPQAAIVSAWSELGEPKGNAAPNEGEPTENSQRARPISEIGDEDSAVERLSTGIHEFDRVLGFSRGAVARAGIVPGSAVLVGGEPGIGKSTLLLQAAASLARSGTRVLYVTSEESGSQVRQRAVRLGSQGENELFLLSDTNLARIVEQARRVLPRVLVIDSIQMIYRSDVPAAPGSITQLRRCASELVYLAKKSGIAVLLVGHVTKDGQLAGPRLLEHLVDTVISFEGERYHQHRVVRAVKNRFGTTLEIGLFEMTGDGLREIPDSAGVSPVAGGEARIGSVVCPVMTGSRCVLVEIQALTATGFLGAAKRKSSGLDSSRLAMLIAVLEQHAGLRLADRDIFASSVGGLKVVDPASDLALLMAIASAQVRKPLDPRTCALGEVGLGGEIRPAQQMEPRVLEAARLGFQRVIVAKGKSPVPKGAKIEIVGVKNVDQALEQLG
ncbi:MAG: DNA repair protein RadA [Phycisphaerales bacterium]|nr:DNA repair protein RadA [Planctomycetota bacterium]